MGLCADNLPCGSFSFLLGPSLPWLKFLGHLSWIFLLASWSAFGASRTYLEGYSPNALSFLCSHCPCSRSSPLHATRGPLQQRLYYLAPSIPAQHTHKYPRACTRLIPLMGDAYTLKVCYSVLDKLPLISLSVAQMSAVPWIPGFLLPVAASQTFTTLC